MAEGFNGFNGFWLRAQVDAPREVGPGEMAAVASTDADGGAFRARPHLGRTVDVAQSFVLVRLPDAGALRTALDRFFDGADAVAAKVGGARPAEPRRDWSHARFDDQTVLRSADLESVRRVAAAWGWSPSPAGPTAGPERDPALTVGGRTLWVRPRRVDGRASDTVLELVARDPGDQGVPLPSLRARVDGVTQTVYRLNRRDHPDDILEGETWYRVKSRAAVDLAAGMTLGDLRRRVEAFAKGA